jgi:1-deoxy-D-xylulose-5-phosphate reductoisomerase
MNAIKRGKQVAFASKECLVAAGRLMMDAVQNSGAMLLPVDSEHNAIYQVYQNSQSDAIKRLILTASGGPFRTWSVDVMAVATPKQAIAHPTWSMGAKISVDSATLMNKALEVIEAHYLFDMPSEQIDVIMHPQSLIHSMVEYSDGSILSQMGPSDMRTPIAYCLGWPDRIETSGPKLDFSTLESLTFEQADTVKFKSLAFVRDVLAEAQCASIVFNASNEIANKAFLDGQIGFVEIYDAIENALCNTEMQAVNNIEDVIAIDKLTRHSTINYISNRNKKIHYA